SPYSQACEGTVPGVLEYFQERGRAVVEPSLRLLLDFFRARGLRVVYTTAASELPDGRDLTPIPQQRNAASRVAVGEVAFPPRTDAWARIVTALEPRPGELVVNKTTFGTFASTGRPRSKARAPAWPEGRDPRRCGIGSAHYSTSARHRRPSGHCARQ